MLFSLMLLSRAVERRMGGAFVAAAYLLGCVVALISSAKPSKPSKLKDFLEVACS